MHINTSVIAIILSLTVLAFLCLYLLFYLPYMPPFNGAKLINKGLSNQYYRKNGKIVHAFNGNFYSHGETPIQEADPQSFEVLAYNYAKDSMHIFYQHMPIENADPNSFKLLAYTPKEFNDQYHFYTLAKDDKHAFYLFNQIDKADAKSFQHLWGDFSADDSSLFFEETRIADLSSEPQRVTADSQGYYLRLGDEVYYHSRLVEGADVQSFQVLQGQLAKDKNHVYYAEFRLLDVDPEGFVYSTEMQVDVLDEHTAKLKQH